MELTTRRNCAFCQHFGGITGTTSIWCNRFRIYESQALATGCVFWSREPGADDEPDPEFWRQLMAELHPPKAPKPLGAKRLPPPLTPDEVREVLRQVERRRAAGLVEEPLR